MAKESVKEKLDKVREHAREIGHIMSKGMKGSAMDGGVGIGTFYAARAAVDHSDTLKQPYYLPGLMFAAGHIMGRKKKLMRAGIGLKAIAGFLAAQTYQQKADQKAQEDQAALNKAGGGGGAAPPPKGAGAVDDDPGWTRYMGAPGNAPQMGAGGLPDIRDEARGVSEASGLID